MCYSAMAWADYRLYVRTFGAEIDMHEFIRRFGDRGRDKRVKIPKGMELPFLDPRTAAEEEIAGEIARYAVEQIAASEQELFKQRKRLADAQRVLQTKTTKKALDDQRIATAKVEHLLGRIADLKRREPKPRDSRIFPGMQALVMVADGDRRVVLPMRYQCRPAGKPAIYDAKYPGTYNARRDNLEGFWKGLFGYSHGLMVVSEFFENVERDGRNVVLEFRPTPPQEMLVACLWSKWVGPDGEELLSFAAITDEPPPEVAAAGHDRCIVPIKPENIDSWLRPDPKNLAAQYAILDDRARPYYEHRLAA